MKSKVKAFVDFRFDHLMKKDILNSYIIIMLFNILLYFLSKGLVDQVLFGTMLFFFIILSNRVLIVKKMMMRTYLYKGIVSIYLNVLFTMTFYYAINIGKQHDFKILFFLFLIATFFNVVSYISTKYNIKKGRYAKEKINLKSKLDGFLLLFLVIIVANFLLVKYMNFSITLYSLLILYFIAILFTFYFMFLFNAFNLQLLKAYYIKKFRLEKDECNQIDLAERLSRC